MHAPAGHQSPLMPPLQDYALIGNCETAAFISTQASIDWLAWPRFDSASCFGALRDGPSGGFWRITPQDAEAQVTRHYLGPTPMLETEIETTTGRARITDFMPTKIRDSHVVRRVLGLAGEIAFTSEIRVRFNNGTTVPYVRRHGDDSLHFIAGPDRVTLRGSVAHEGQDETYVAAFKLSAGETVDFSLTYTPAYTDAPRLLDPKIVAEQTERTWRAWIGRCTYDGPYAETVIRALITLRTLIYQPSGGIIATAEPPSGDAEDKRLCRLAGAHLGMRALLDAGYEIEAKAWRNFLLRAIAGEPAKLRSRYGIIGERLAGPAAPLQLYGDIFLALSEGRRYGLHLDPEDWSLESEVLRRIEDMCEDMCFDATQESYGKFTALIAFERGMESIEKYGCAGPIDPWRECHRRLAAEINTLPVDADTRLLSLLDADNFLKHGDRLCASLAAIEQNCLIDGLVRYDGKEAVSLSTNFHYVAALAHIGRVAEAHKIFERAAALANDVGLFGDAYDFGSKQRIGMFPDTATHVALINAAYALARTEKA